MGTEFFAHVKRNNDSSWSVHRLEEHLEGVARMAGEFAAEFGLVSSPPDDESSG